MDAHLVPGVKAREVARAHHQDLVHQEEFGCKCMTYWVDEQRETIFCLVDARDKDAVRNLHNRAHGMVPNKIIEVSSAVVQSFLGRIYDPEYAVMEEGYKVFSEASYRFLLVIRTEDPLLLKHRLGNQQADELLQQLRGIIRRNILLADGTETEHNGENFIISFTSAQQALACARAILTDIPAPDRQCSGFRATITGGEPVEKSNSLFGDAISLADILSSLISHEQVGLSVPVKERVAKESHYPSLACFSLSPPDEVFLQALLHILEERWQEPDFAIPGFSQAMAMSPSRLYRRTLAVTGVSCNNLLRNYRLEKAKELLKQKKHSIAQVSFECGFSSPSYFTKCFKDRYGLLPNAFTLLLP